ncbi:16S rRNA (uracil(1498)-N(3))-methyltransferase [Gracilibacillus alcaliphilus]|uniref:16S rRNA (uracil(1498)-N(3))-methyltransferase n=1 Tax=Gracilibacillus alcaliphilus TaxID=1401441 RepID=UPI00195C2936|nr:16S rRNA (uracil1498-N3)-methyltransferase [Gracilibacillus alcaliphilus]
MQRYFVKADNWQQQMVIITGQDYHHMVHVMRLNPGDRFIANQPNGQAALCEIIAIQADSIEAEVQQWLQEEVELPVSVTIAQGIPKGDKWETILQKGTELGAATFIPFQAHRSVAKWDEKKVAKKLPRWNKIVKEASEQSHRTVIPEVTTVKSFKKLLEMNKSYDWLFFAYEEAAREVESRPLSYYFSQIKPGQSVLICIGPEGGFTEEEARAYQASGFQAIRLGPRILRTETAPLYVLAGLSYQLEELNN